MKKALIFMMQPPGSSGVSASKYNKILPFMKKHGWELHFVGPDPRIASLYHEPNNRESELCHYTRSIAPSRYFMIKRNRIKGQSLRSVLYGICQKICFGLEKMFCFDAYKYLEKELITKATKSLRQHDYHVIGGICPDFKILKTAYDFARLNQKPFLAIYDDPHGAREMGQFYPAEPEKQKEILNFASVAAFASPLTRDRYVKQGLVAAQKTFFTYDSFPELQSEVAAGIRNLQKINMVHLGNLPAYRPIDSILQAFEVFRSKQDNPRLELDFHGYVYPEAIRMIKNSASLSQTIHVHKEVTHSESHQIARESDMLVVVIGPRHIDNIPSKFFEYLCHPKPVLVIGPKGNPLETILNELRIGVYCEIENSEEIAAGIAKIVSGYHNYQEAFNRNRALLSGYSAQTIAGKWAAIFNQALLREV